MQSYNERVGNLRTADSVYPACEDLLPSPAQLHAAGVDTLRKRQHTYFTCRLLFPKGFPKHIQVHYETMRDALVDFASPDKIQENVKTTHRQGRIITTHMIRVQRSQQPIRIIRIPDVRKPEKLLLENVTGEGGVNLLKHKLNGGMIYWLLREGLMEILDVPHLDEADDEIVINVPSEVIKQVRSQKGRRQSNHSRRSLKAIQETVDRGSPDGGPPAEERDGVDEPSENEGDPMDMTDVIEGFADAGVETPGSSTEPKPSQEPGDPTTRTEPDDPAQVVLQGASAYRITRTPDSNGYLPRRSLMGAPGQPALRVLMPSQDQPFLLEVANIPPQLLHTLVQDSLAPARRLAAAHSPRHNAAEIPGRMEHDGEVIDVLGQACDEGSAEGAVLAPNRNHSAVDVQRAPSDSFSPQVAMPRRNVRDAFTTLQGWFTVVTLVKTASLHRVPPNTEDFTRLKNRWYTVKRGIYEDLADLGYVVDEQEWKDVDPDTGKESTVMHFQTRLVGPAEANAWIQRVRGHD